MKREKEEMNDACGMHGICPLLAGETGTMGQRRGDLETINAISSPPFG